MLFVHIEPTETVFSVSKSKQSSQKLKTVDSRFNYVYILYERKARARPIRRRRSVRGKEG